MCVRHTYYCHGCRQCFGVPLLSTFDQRCRSREPENVLVDLLCTDDENCLRRTEEGARENMGTHPFHHNRCSQMCLAQSCYVKAFFMPCRDCFLRDWRSVHSYSNAHWRRVESNAVPLACPIKRAERLLSEERNRLLMEQIRQWIAAPQIEPFQLPRSRG